MNRLLRIIFLLLLSTTIFSEFDSLENIKVPLSIIEPKKLGFRFVMPNERMPGYFKEKIADINGLMVSVGSFRSLITYAWAPNISHLLMADINKDMAQFNIDHLSLIKCIYEKYPQSLYLQRLQYLAHLQNKAIVGEVLEMRDIFSYLKKIMHKQAISEAKEENCLHIVNNSEGLKYASRQINNTIANFPDLPFLNLASFWHGPFYYQDDNLWQKIIQGIEGNKIAVTWLDIANQEDLLKLKNFIDETYLSFGIFDISNVYNHLLKLNNNMHLAWRNNLIDANLNAELVLMTSYDNFRLLSDFNLNTFTETGDSWYYYAVPWTNFLNFLAIESPEKIKS